MFAANVAAQTLAPSWAPAHIIGARVDGSNLPPAASNAENMKATHTVGGCEILHQLIGGLSMFIIVYPFFRGFQLVVHDFFHPRYGG